MMVAPHSNRAKLPARPTTSPLWQCESGRQGLLQALHGMPPPEAAAQPGSKSCDCRPPPTHSTQQETSNSGWIGQKKLGLVSLSIHLPQNFALKSAHPRHYFSSPAELVGSSSERIAVLAVCPCGAAVLGNSGLAFCPKWSEAHMGGAFSK